MHWRLREMIERILERYRRSRIWRRVVNTLACFVVFCTTYALILPAITMETVANCDMEEHKHGQECYVQTVTVSACTASAHVHTIECENSCGKADFLIHSHAGHCFGADGSLICTLPEIPEHKHSESCYEMVEVPAAETEPVETVPQETVPQETVPVVEVHSHCDACYENQQGALVCQTPEETIHTHEAACSDAEGVLICTIPEVTVHQHESSCYEQIQNLTCGLEEGAEVIVGYETVAAEPEATEPVAAEPAAQTEPVLICTLEELYLHTHNETCVDCGLLEVSKHDHEDSCFQTVDVTDETYTAPLTCALAESEEHQHDFLCYGTWRLVCEKEEHTHGLICKSDAAADVETPAQWESTFAHVELTESWAENILLIAETQLGYRESELNYAVWADETVHGYTRYGDWYGMPHADWCGMFVSFCMNYAGVEEVPLNYGVRPWIQDLSSEEVNIYRLAGEYTPNPGDMVFFDWEGDGLSDHVGFVYELIEATEEEPAKLKTIEGNSSNRVQYVTYELDDACLLGYGDIAAAQANYEIKRELRHTAQFTGGDYTVTVKYSDMAGIPEGAQLVVEEILPGDERYQSFLEQVEAGESETSEITYFRALDVHFALDDQEIPLNAEVQVSVTFTEAEQDDLNVVHFADDGTVDQPESTTELGETGDSTVSFNTDSFSGIVLYATSTASETATKFYFKTVDPTALVTGKNYVIYTKTGDDTYVFLTSLESCPAVTVTGTGDSTNPITVGGSWQLTAEQVSSYTLAGLSWQLELPADTTATYKRLFSNGYDTDNYTGYEYLCFNKDDLQTWTSQEGKGGNLNLKITATTGAGAYILAADGTSYGRTKIYYDSTYTDVKQSWRAVAATESATTVYFAEISTECEHNYEYTATLPTTCVGVTSATATRTCTKCGDTRTTNATESISKIISYANQLRSSNVKDDYSVGGFTWDTETKTWSWTYYNGVMLDAFMKVGTDTMHDYVAAFYDDALAADGTPLDYHTGEVDSVPMALALFDLLGTGTSTQDQRYEAAIHYVYNQLSQQTELGAEYGYNFWHKTTSDSWATWKFGLDGLYMANTFLMEYANALEAGKLENKYNVDYSDIYEKVYTRLNWVANTMYDSTTQLYHHGWNGSNGNGHFWGRGIGWYAVAIVDIIDMMPAGTYKSGLIGQLPKLFDGMLKYQDEATGMWYNVVNRDATLTDNNGNKLETSVSSMMAYAMMKASSKGWVGSQYGEAGLRALDGVVKNKMTESDGSYSVVDTYKSSGVKETDADYLTNTYTTNEAKGVGALIMAAVVHDHDWTDWAVSEAQAAAAEETTTETRTCTVCGEIQTRTVTTEKTIIGWNFTVVDPTKLEDGEVYAVYANDGSENYVFLFSDTSSPNAIRVVTTDYEPSGYGTAPQTIGGTWYVPVGDLSENEADFTWKAETTVPDGYTGNLLLQAQGFYTTTPGDRYLSVREASNRDAQTYPKEGDAGRPQYISLTVNAAGDTAVDADCTIVNTNRNYHLILATDGGDDWKVSSDNDTVNTPVSATPVVFAKVTPVYEEPEETYTFQVLGTEGPVEGKKYVIYFPYTTTVTLADGTTTERNDVKFLGSIVNTSKNGNFSFGADDVEDTMAVMQRAGSEWTLEASKMSGFTVEELQWTVVKVGDDWCLQSVADPTLHLKLVCTNTNGNSQVNSTAYDSQGAQYFSLDFTSSGDTTDSWYTVTTEDGSHELRFNNVINRWEAITSGFTDENGNEINATQIYFAEVIEEEDSGTSEGKTEQRFAGYTFTTLDPDALYDGQIVTIYTRPDSSVTDTYTFMYSTMDIPPVTVSNTGYDTQPVTIDQTWDMTSAQMGDSMDAFTWVVEKDADGTIRLASLGYQPDNEDRFPGPEYLRLYTNQGGTSVQTWWNDTNVDGIVDLTVNSGDGADCTIYSAHDKHYLVYDPETDDWVFSDTGMTVYFASVAPKYVDVPVGTNFPDGVHTGDTTVNTLRFYNFVESGGEHISALPGCTFVIKGVSDTSYQYTIVSGDNPELHLPSDIPDGTYTIEEVSAPKGYLRDVNPVREFTISGGKFAEETGSDGTTTKSIGTFLNHAENLIAADKVAEVEDYNNRTYEIMLSAMSDLRLYQMNPVDVLFVVDQSNSMLFPAGLSPTGASVTLHRNLGITNYDERATNNTDQLDALLEAGTLNEDTVYYIIADESVTSTVYAIWYNGETWMYQDASYYAKATHENAPGYQQADGELAILPSDAALSDQPTSGTVTYISSYDSNGDPVYVTVDSDKLKANGGGLSYEIGNCTLGKDIAATGADNDGTEKTYKIYTATNSYNRLHYLQDALAHAIHQLADANPENTVTLIRFNRTTKNNDCMGPLTLNPDNVNSLVEAVSSINTGGGTRQDIALEHAYNHLTGGTFYERDDMGKFTDVEYTLTDEYTKGKLYTFTVLITDGAPVGSGNEKNLGVADAATSSTATGDPVYDRIRGFAEKVREESILMTIGLGMGGVEGGGTVLERIADGYVADDQENIYHKMLEDAEDLMNTLKQLLFSSMVPREKVDLMGDITDVISDSFYPIAWVEEGQAPSDRKLLTMKDPQDTEKDWIILEPGDWITCEGQYVGPSQTDGDLYGIGRLTVNTDGDFQITWTDQLLYDCQLVWVPTKAEVPADRRIVMTEENVEVNGTPSGYGRYWFALNEGEYVYAHGEYVADPSNPKTGTVPYAFVKQGMTYQIAGRYETAAGADRAHIQWNSYYNVDFDANFQPYGGHGKFYVKAKEDFIGGNAIDTNKSAEVSVQENDGDTTDEVIGTIALPTPTVNVRLLDMNQNSSEVTVFLGDQINAIGNSPLDSLKYFFNSTTFDKLVDDFADKTDLDYGPIMNALDPAAQDDGLLEDVFYLRYAMGRELTAEEWTKLANGEAVKVEYTYDDASSHGPVGYFTFQLTKTGDTADYAQHTATKACEKQHTHDGCDAPVETYTLHVTYTAYRLGEDYKISEGSRPSENVHNGSDGPGTEVGTGATLPTGLGVVDKDDVHKVHVISGQIQVTKEVTGGVSSEDKTFEFTLHRTEDGTSTTNDQKLYITVKANESTAVATVSGLERGHWVLTETPVLGYQLQSITVVADGTNCYSTVTDNGRSVTFEIGDNKSDVNVIGPASSVAGTTVAANGKDVIPTAPVYTSYTDSPNGVQGEAEVTNLMMTYELPEAGGAGTNSYTLGGILLISLASILFLWYNKERRKEDWASS